MVSVRTARPWPAVCLSAAGKVPGFPQDFWGRKGGLSHSLGRGHAWDWG